MNIFLEADALHPSILSALFKRGLIHSKWLPSPSDPVLAGVDVGTGDIRSVAVFELTDHGLELLALHREPQ